MDLLPKVSSASWAGSHIIFIQKHASTDRSSFQYITSSPTCCKHYTVYNIRYWYTVAYRNTSTDVLCSYEYGTHTNTHTNTHNTHEYAQEHTNIHTTTRTHEHTRRHTTNDKYLSLTHTRTHTHHRQASITRDSRNVRMACMMRRKRTAVSSWFSVLQILTVLSTHVDIFPIPSFILHYNRYCSSSRYGYQRV